MTVELIRPFGPSIAKVKIPNQLIDDLNEYIDNIIENKQKAKELSAGAKLAGDVTQEFKLEQEFSKKVGWLDFISKSVFQWISISRKVSIKEFKMIDSWVVRQFQNEYNPVHMHGGHVSGAGFLKVPTNMGKHSQKGKELAYRGGNLQLIHGSRMFLCHSTLDLVPSVGDFYFFPNYLMHTVFPFKDTNEKRRSISFNAVIDDEIYNVYGR